MHLTEFRLRPPLQQITGLLVLALLAGLIMHQLHARGLYLAAIERQQFDRALILTLYGDEYRNLPPTANRQPLQALKNRYPDLEIPARVESAFANQGNGYVLLIWIAALPADSRQTFLLGLRLVIEETSRQGGNLAAAINAFHAHFQLSRHAGVTSEPAGTEA